MSARIAVKYFSSCFFIARLGRFKTHFSFAGLAQPVEKKITFHLPARPNPLKKITFHLSARPAGKITSHLPARPVRKIISHALARPIGKIPPSCADPVRPVGKITLISRAGYADLQPRFLRSINWCKSIELKIFIFNIHLY